MSTEARIDWCRKLKLMVIMMAAATFSAMTAIPVSAADDAALLGPQSTVSPATNPTTGASSTQTGSALQPAGTAGTPLQSADAQSAGISIPQSQTLQQTGGADQIKLLLQGEGEGELPIEEPYNYSWMLPILAVLGLAIAITGILILLERRRQPTA